MGSIGYIGGNIGYLGTNSLNMDYPYEHGTAHYQLWKPPGNYFVRGEAPPPYEEAIALAQTESLNTCTVSVATSTQRQYPMAIPETETTQTITANTTNLINININNGGNLTTIATGENHIPGNESASSLSNDRAHIEALNVNNDVGNHEQCLPLPASYYAIPISTAEICTNQYCNLKYSNNSNYSLLSKTNVKEVQTYTNQKASSITRSTLLEDRSENIADGCEYSNNCKNHQLPIVNNTTNASDTANGGIAINTKARSTSKHFHRTIPRHFGAVDPLINPLKNNRNNVINHTNTSCINENSGNLERTDTSNTATKRMPCQCPVQHMPISISTAHSVLNQTNNELALHLTTDNSRESTLKKHNSSEFIKQVNIPNRIAAPTAMNPTEISNLHCKGTLKRNHDKLESGNRNIHYNTVYTKTQRLSSKGKCISNVSKTDNHPVLRKQNSLPKRNRFSNHSSSTVNNVPGTTERNSNSSRLDTNIRIPTIVQSHSSNDENNQAKIISNAAINTNVEQNPELPPKMYKNYNSRSTETHQKSYYSNSKTHAISKPSKDISKFSIPSSSSVRSFRNIDKMQKNYSKSLPRNVISASLEYTHINRSTVQPYSITDSSNTNVNFNTLPKKTSKPNTRSTNLLTEVVNKVPSVINIPSPLLTEVSHRSSITNYSQSLQTMNKQSSKIISHDGYTCQSAVVSVPKNTKVEKPLPIFTTSNNCANPKEHFLPNDNSLDDEYLSECENCKSAHGSRYYLEEDIDDAPQETMTLQRKLPENEEDQQNYYRVSSTLPTNTSRKTPTTKNRETWFTTIPASSSSEEEEGVE